jgi:hypothetical protein
LGALTKLADLSVLWVSFGIQAKGGHLIRLGFLQQFSIYDSLGMLRYLQQQINKLELFQND